MDAYSYLRLNKLIRRVFKYFIQVKKLDVNTSL